jgi:methylated-DNA-[protein]-cysteine S-methyltransferase
VGELARYDNEEEAMIEVTEMKSPLGRIRVASRDGELIGIGFDQGWDRVATKLGRELDDELKGVAHDSTGTLTALKAYFDGDLRALEGIPVRPQGTMFQTAVWAALKDIPVGETISYSTLAARVGAPGAVRAAGSANGANPACLVIPCHRVIRSDGSLGGYAGGLHRKEWLLEHERRHTVSSA